MEVTIAFRNGAKFKNTNCIDRIFRLGFIPVCMNDHEINYMAKKCGYDYEDVSSFFIFMSHDGEHGMECYLGDELWMHNIEEMSRDYGDETLIALEKMS